MDKYFLERRIRKLEKLLYEKTVTRGNDSRAYTIWKLLRDEGPLTRPEIRDRLGWTTPIVEMEAEGCVIKRGNRYEYNPDYNWEDVGVIPRTAQQELQQQQRELQQAIRSGNLEVDDATVATSNEPTEEQPQEAPSRGRNREPRAPREPRQREVKQNIFSRKFAEVKAAVDAGQNVNQTDSKGRTPLFWACMSDKPEAAEIVNYLLSHRANPDPRNSKGATAIFMAIKYGNLEVIKALAPRANLGYKYDGNIPFIAATNEGIYDEEALLALIPTRLISVLANTEGDILIGITRRLIRFSHFTNKTKVTIFDRCVEALGNKFYNIIYGSHILEDISKNDMIIYNAVIKSKSFPAFYGGRSEIVSSSPRVLYELHKLMLQAVEENFKFKDMQNFLLTASFVEAAIRIAPENSVFSNLPITKESMFKLDNEAFTGLASYYIVKCDLEAIRKLVNVKYPIKGKNAGKILDKIVEVANYTTNDKDIISNSLRLLNHAVNPDYAANSVYYHVANVKNEYIIDWAIDHGLGKLMASSYGNKSNICVTKLIEAGYTIDSSFSSVEKEADRQISKIVDCIENDNWNNDLERYVNNHPEILLNDKITDAIEENDTYTASQLKRKIADLPKDVYDF